MTVKELIEHLRSMPPNAKVCINQNYQLPEISSIECYGQEGVVVLHECDDETEENES